MKQLADGVWRLAGFPPNAINVYLLEDVLIDASTKYATRRIVRELKGHTLAAHALTHAHPDHQGASHAICERYGVPYWVGEKDADAAEDPKLIGERQPDHFMAQFFAKTMTGPGHHVDRKLREGDDVAGFRVIDVPGHSAGHVAFWRESDGVLVARRRPQLGRRLSRSSRGLSEPRAYFTPDPAENRRSARKLALLEPKLALFGHGPPVTDTKKLVDFINGLPD